MKTLFYAKVDIMPTIELHFILGVAADGTLIPDMTTPVYLRGQVLSSSEVKSIREFAGNGLVGSFRADNPFGHPYTNVRDGHRFYMPAFVSSRDM